MALINGPQTPNLSVPTLGPTDDLNKATINAVLNTLDTRINVVADETQALSTHEADTTNVHGITNTANLLATADTPANGEVLTYTTAGGVNWAAAAGGGSSDLTLLAATTGTATSATWVPVDNLFTSTYLNYKLLVDWIPAYTYPGDVGKMVLWDGAAPINSNHVGGYIRSGAVGGTISLTNEYALTSVPSSYYYSDYSNHSEIDIAVTKSSFTSRALVVNIKTTSYNDDDSAGTIYQAGTMRNVSAEDSENLEGKGVAFKPSAASLVGFRIRAYGYNSILAP